MLNAWSMWWEFGNCYMQLTEGLEQVKPKALHAETEVQVSACVLSIGRKLAFHPGTWH